MSTKKHPIERLVHHLKPLGITVLMPIESYKNPETLKKMADAIDDGEISQSELQAVTITLYKAIKPV